MLVFFLIEHKTLYFIFMSKVSLFTHNVDNKYIDLLITIHVYNNVSIFTKNHQIENIMLALR